MERQWLGKRPKIVATVILVGSALLPLCSMPSSAGSTVRHWPMRLALADPGFAVVLVVAYLWPLLVLGLITISRGTGRRVASAVVEPILPLVSMFLLWVVCRSTLGFAQPLGPWLMIPVRASLDTGAYVAFSANVAYLVAWSVAVAAATRRRRPAEAT